MGWFFFQRIGRRSARRATGTLLVLVVLGLALFAIRARSEGKANAAVGWAGSGRLLSPASGPPSAEGIPVPPGPALAPRSLLGDGQDVDHISCSAGTQFQIHIHAHLSIFVDGKPRQIPGAIGIKDPVTDGTDFVTGGTCLYGLHTHANDGVIHVESPSVRTYSLGEFFAIWGQPFDAHRIGPARGTVTAFYNGELVRGGDLRSLSLSSHAEIQLEIGRPLVSPQKIDFKSL